MTGRLQNKVAIITGAGCIGPGWGNGRATVVRFVQEGARVLAVDRDPDAMLETLERVRALGGAAEPWQCDVTDERAVAAMVAACIARFGRVDILVNNVGGSARGGPVDLAPADWQRQIDFNLTSVYLSCRHVLPVMVEQGGGAIVNTSSTSGLRWTGSAQCAYA
ncbi:MAG: SDR family NAD(P)-dependent oxidoreductase, partial [Thermomicrobiales bacterium]|nr:SDR family NAD(P)-dependent oxidoreductase [Thermomicrobiales bacterium]